MDDTKKNEDIHSGLTFTSLPAGLDFLGDQRTAGYYRLSLTRSRDLVEQLKTFSLRFDIDTPKCLTHGVPNLLDLADRLGVQFSFFLSVGRGISRTGTLLRMLTRPESQVTAASLSALAKLGIKDYLKTAILNPLIGKGHLSIVRRIYISQELGLHGGVNHDDWHHGAHAWSGKRLSRELDYALAWLRTHEMKVDGFSCPGWTEAPGLSAALIERGFRYRADLHGPDLTGGTIEQNGFCNLATNILGEPGGVAYLEHLRAAGRSDKEIEDDFQFRLGKVGNYAVAYDHPYFAGVRELKMVERLVIRARDFGYRILPLRALAKELSPQTGSK